MCAVRQLSGGRMQCAARPARLGCGMECALMLQALTLTLPSPGGRGNWSLSAFTFTFGELLIARHSHAGGNDG